MIEREKKRQKLVDRYATKRAALKEIIKDESKPMLMYNGELHPFENQPKGSEKYAEYKAHKLT